MKIISIAVFLLSLIALQINAEQAQKPTPDEVRLYMHGRLSQKEEIRIGRWMMKNGIEFLPLLLEIQETTDNTFIKSGTMHVVSRSVSKETSQSVIDRLLEEDTTQAAKTTALEIAEKYGYEGERYRTVLIDVLTSTEYGGLQERLLKLLQTYGREEDAELVLEIFKNSEVRNIKPDASDTLLAIGGPDIIEPWEEELARLREAEPERLRKQKEKIERLSEQEGITFGPLPEGPSWIDYIEEDLQSLKEKVAAQQNTSSSNDKPDAVLKAEDTEPDARQKPANAGNRDTASINKSWNSLLLPGLALLIAITAATFFLIRRRT